MSKECELCILDRINHVFYNCDDFIILACDSCNVPMVVPYEHIDPTVITMPTMEETIKMKDLKSRMSTELYKVAYEFFDGPEFYIDTKENKIPNHMHWHARPIKEGSTCGVNLKKITNNNLRKLKQLGIL